MIKIALPKGDVQEAVREFLTAQGIDFSGYHKDARAYGSEAADAREVFSKQFREKDIPIQVSFGNYDLGFCGSQWVVEYLARYPQADIMNLRTLDITDGDVCACCAASEGDVDCREALARMAARGPVRIATEFSALAEALALKWRLPDFRIFQLWGAAEAYPPEGAELALMNVRDPKFIEVNKLKLLETLFTAKICLIANRNSFNNKDLTVVLEKLAR